MGKYSIISLDSIESAYISFATYVLESYDDNVLDLLEAVSRLSQAKDSNISKY